MWSCIKFFWVHCVVAQQVHRELEGDCCGGVSLLFQVWTLPEIFPRWLSDWHLSSYWMAAPQDCGRLRHRFVFIKFGDLQETGASAGAAKVKTSRFTQLDSGVLALLAFPLLTHGQTHMSPLQNKLTKTSLLFQFSLLRTNFHNNSIFH